MEDPGALAVAGAAPQPTVGGAPGAVVAGDDVVEGTRLPAPHPRVGLIDRVPGEALGDAADLFKTPAAEELDRAVNVVGRDLEPVPAAVLVGLDQAAAG